MRNIIVLLIISLIMMCTEYPHVNPLDDHYENDNTFTTDLTSIENLEMSIFKKYVISYNETGTDSFKYLALTDSVGNSIVDSSILNNRLKTDTILNLYFIKPYTGTVYLKGIYYNDKEFTETGILTIKNPFKIVADTLIGTSSTNSILISNYLNYTLDTTSLKIIWKIGEKIDTASWDSVKEYSYTASTLTFSINAGIIDSFNNLINLSGVTVNSKGYSPVIDSLSFNKNIKQGDTLSVVLKMHDNDKDIFKINCYIDGVLFDSVANIDYDTLFKTIKFNKPILDTGEITISYKLIDVDSLSSEIFSSIKEVAYVYPMPAFSSQSVSIPLNSDYTLRAFDKNYDLSSIYIWQCADTLDTLNSDSIVLSYDSVGVDTITVNSYNKYGIKGKSDTIIVNIIDIDYSINKDTFPVEILPDKWSTFSVKVLNDSNQVITSDVVYIWSVENKDDFDSLSIVNNNLYLKASADNISPFNVSVYAIVNGVDTTNIINESVYISLKPECLFKSDTLKVIYGDSATIKIIASDDEQIDSIFLVTDTGMINLGTDTSYLYNSKTLDLVKFTTFAVDNKGNYSDTSLLVIINYTENPILTPDDSSITSGYIYDTLSLYVTGYAGNKISTITSYYWDLDGDGVYDDTTDAGVYSLIKTAEYKDSIFVSCANSLDDTAVSPASFYIDVDAGKPIINSTTIVEDSILETDSVLIVVSGNDVDGNVVSLEVDTNSDTVSDISFTVNESSFSISKYIPFHFSGTVDINVWVIDNYGNKSTIKNAGTIKIIEGNPVVKRITPDTVDLKDSNTFTIIATDNEEVATYTWSKDSLTFTDIASGDSTFKTAFNDSGWNYLYAYVTDNLSKKSTVLKDSVYVTYNVPVIDSVVLFVDSVWSQDSVSYVIYFHDKNDSVVKVSIDWGDETTNELNVSGSVDSVLVKHVYTYHIDTVFVPQFEIMDNDSIKVDTSINVNVYESKPVIDSVVLSVDSVWSQDSVSYIIYFHDKNDSVVKVSIDWGDETTNELNVSGSVDSVLVKHVYTYHIDTVFVPQFEIMDNDSIKVDTSISVNVYDSRPEISVIGIDTTDNNLFVNDIRKYRINSFDPNGKIKKIYVSWNGDYVPEDSLVLDTNLIDTSFENSYDTLNTGSKTITFWSVDDDSLVSDLADTTIYIRLCAPILKADTIDTLWVIVDNGTGENYTLHVNSLDTNGTIQRYYWHEAATFDTSSGSCVKTADSTRTRNIGVPDMHTGISMHIYGKDDDGLMRGSQFVIYADSVPPAPDITSDAVSGGRKISWSKKDAKDGDNTQYQILCDLNNPPTTVISDYKAGSEYDSGGAYDYSHVFTPSSGNGIYYYKVIAKDARGSETASNIVSFSYTE